MFLFFAIMWLYPNQNPIPTLIPILIPNPNLEPRANCIDTGLDEAKKAEIDIVNSFIHTIFASYFSIVQKACIEN